TSISDIFRGRMRLFRRNDIEIELHFSSGEDKVKSIKVKLRHARDVQACQCLIDELVAAGGTPKKQKYNLHVVPDDPITTKE
ncbi:hypothetical protein, partial [Escherichia coli]